MCLLLTMTDVGKERGWPNSILGDPELYQLQSKNMSVVFWDISSFSVVCKLLDKQPILAHRPECITGGIWHYRLPM